MATSLVDPRLTTAPIIDQPPAAISRKTCSLHSRPLERTRLLGDLATRCCNRRHTVRVFVSRTFCVDVERGVNVLPTKSRVDKFPDRVCHYRAVFEELERFFSESGGMRSMCTDRSVYVVGASATLRSERALVMPYFQRRTIAIERSNVSDRRWACRPRGRERRGVLDRRAKLGQSSIERRRRKESTANGVAGGARQDREDGLVSIADVPGLADLQTRASEGLRSVPRGVSRPASLATRRARRRAPPRPRRRDGAAHHEPSASKGWTGGNRRRESSSTIGPRQPILILYSTDLRE